MGKFVVTTITNLENTKIGDTLEESDYSITTSDNKFIQFTHIDDENRKAEPYIVNPGIWSIQKSMAGLVLQETKFVVDKLLETHSITKLIREKIDTFFSRFHIYYKRNRLPIRKFLLYGVPGTGKTSSIIAAVDEYTNDNKTATVVWHTDKYEAYQVKDFLKTFAYKGCEKLILIMEDIGGVERDEGVRPSESSLLSLLDNKEETFTIPTLIIATTNHPETLLGNLTNRPGRFSDKIEVGYPTAKERVELLKFFFHGDIDESAINLIESSKSDTFTPDHIKNIVENAELYDKTLDQAILDMHNETQLFNKGFTKKDSVRSAFYDE